MKNKKLRKILIIILIIIVFVGGIFAGKAIEARKYSEDGSIKQTEITTGISNDAYTEVKSGLNEGDIVYIEKSTSSSNFFNYRNRQFQGMNSGNSQGYRNFKGGDRRGMQN